MTAPQKQHHNRPRMEKIISAFVIIFAVAVTIETIGDVIYQRTTTTTTTTTTNISNIPEEKRRTRRLGECPGINYVLLNDARYACEENHVFSSGLEECQTFCSDYYRCCFSDTKEQEECSPCMLDECETFHMCLILSRDIEKELETEGDYLEEQIDAMEEKEEEEDEDAVWRKKQNPNDDPGEPHPDPIKLQHANFFCDITFVQSNGIVDCRKACEDYVCCFEEPKPTCHKAECSSFKACTMIWDADELAEIGDPEAVKEECDEEALSDKEGRFVCKELCDASERKCCWDKSGDNCFDGNEEWCDEYKPCKALYELISATSP